MTSALGVDYSNENMFWYESLNVSKYEYRPLFKAISIVAKRFKCLTFVRNKNDRMDGNRTRGLRRPK